MRSRVLLISLLLGAPSMAADKVTYDDQILPVFQQSCLNCHNPDKNKGGLDLSSFSGTMKGSSGGKVVEPGDAGSRLLACVMQTSDKKMPPEGDKLGADKISLIKAWIDGGLLENKSSSARKASKPKFDTALGAATTGKPEGPPPMPKDVLLEPAVVASRASSVHAMVASPWAPLLAITGEHQVLLVNTETLELAGILPFPEGDPISLSFTPNARYLIVGGGVPGKSGVTVTYDVVSGERMLVAGKEFDSILAADLTPDLSTVATGSPSRLLKMWKAEDGSMIRSIKKHTDWVTAVDFSPDGILLASGDRGGGVWVWETGSGSEFQTLRGHQGAITAVSFRADSNLLASASEDGTVRFWEMNGGNEVKKITAHNGGVLSFAWYHDGSFITSGRDHIVKLWKPDFNLLREFKDQPDICVAVACDFEGKRAFAADYRGIVSVWDIASGKPVGQFDANPPTIAARLSNLKEDMRKQVEVIAAADQKTTTAQTALASAQGRLAELIAQETQAKSSYEATAGQVQHMKQQVQLLTQSGAQLKAGLDQAKAKDEEITKQLAQTQSAPELAGLKERKEQAEAELAKANAVFEDETKKLETAKAAAAAAMGALPGLEKRAKDAESAIGPANEALAPLDKAHKEALATADAEKGRISTLAQQARHWEAAAVNAESLKVKAAADREASELEGLSADLKALSQTAESVQTKIASLNQEKETLEAKRQSAAQDLAALKECETSLTSIHSQLESAVKEQASTLADLTAAKQRLEEATPAAKSLKEQAEQLKSRYVSLQEQKAAQ